MKAEIEIDGSIMIEAGSETEAYALKNVYDKIIKDGGFINFIWRPSGSMWCNCISPATGKIFVMEKK